MRKFGLLHPLLLAFYSQSLYQDVAKNWRGVTFLYLLLVLSLCWLPLMARLQMEVTKFVEKDSARALQQIPRITIKDGAVSTDVDTPYTITDPETGKPFAIIDLTGKYESLADTEAKVLLTKSQVFVRNRPRETRVYDLSGIKEFSMDRARVEGWLHLGQKWFVLILFPFTLFFVYSYRLAQAFVYGLIGLLIAKILHVSLGYMASVRLAIIAITPMLVLDMVLSLVKFHPPAWWLLAFAIPMGYLAFGIKAASLPPAESPAPLPGQA